MHALHTHKTLWKANLDFSTMLFRTERVRNTAMACPNDKKVAAATVFVCVCVCVLRVRLRLCGVPALPPVLLLKCSSLSSSQAHRSNGRRRNAWLESIGGRKTDNWRLWGPHERYFAQHFKRTTTYARRQCAGSACRQRHDVHRRFIYASAQHSFNVAHLFFLVCNIESTQLHSAYGIFYAVESAVVKWRAFRCTR